MRHKSLQNSFFFDSPRLAGRLAVLFFALLIWGCSGNQPIRHEVSGTVLVDGQPAERVVVQFQLQDVESNSEDRFPVGYTDAEGRFLIGEKSARRGAIAGRYLVSFVWLSSGELDAVDQFEGRYSTAGSTEFEVIVPVAEPIVFELSSRGR